ncbi:MAG: POTRA domain-containing protein [Vicinamibacterales bacterium]
MTWRLAGLVLAALLAVAAPARADVTDYLGRPIAAVSVLVEGRVVTDPRVLALVETTPGRTLGMREVRESLTHLFSLAVYEDVQVKASLGTNGVSLVYELVPLHPVEEIAFSGGAPGIEEGGLRQMLFERFGRSPRAARAADMARAIEDTLRDEGYLRARVTPRAAVEHQPDRTLLTFAIDPGTRARLGTITVEGTPGMPASALLAQLDLATGQPYERQRLLARIERHLNEMRRRSFYEARLSAIPVFSTDGRTVDLRLTAIRGPVVHLQFEGDPVPDDRRDELVPVAREGSADEDLLEDSSNRIQDFFRAQGYRDAKAPYRREERNGDLFITFTVTRGSLHRVSAVEVTGNVAVPAADLLARLRVRAGQPFSAAALDADLTQIEELYRRVGYTAARAEATTVPGPPGADQQVPVAIRIDVVENAQTLVSSVRIEGNQSVPEGDLLASLSLAPGAPFSLARLAADRDAIELMYANRGYQNVTVESRQGLSVDTTRADVVFAVREGPRVIVDHVLIVGNTRTKTETIERELQFKAGDPLGLEAISESQRRLASLGLFRRARITQLGRGDEAHRDVLVTVDEAPLTTVGWGGGFEVRSRVVRSPNDPTVASEQLQFAPRASFEVGRRNLFGTNRSVNLFTSASLHPRNSPVFANQDQSTLPDTGGWGFPQYRVLGQFRQPRILQSRADFRVTGTFEQQIRSSFNFSRRAVSAELAVRLPRNMSASGGYQIQRTRVFNQSVDPSQQRSIDRLFPKVRISSFVASVIRDTRNDPVDPSHGQYMSANGQMAARAIGSEVGFMKSFVTAQSFRTLPGQRGVVFATSARVGAAVGFPNASGSRDLPASERFFAGGDTTVRSFALDRLGVTHTPRRASDTIDPAGFPLGGNALLILNGELRIPVRTAVRLVTFADVGNVFNRVTDVNVGDLRSALGVGFRYKSPVGPLRFDLGFKVPRRGEESRIQWFITFGEAF